MLRRESAGGRNGGQGEGGTAVMAAGMLEHLDESGESELENEWPLNMRVECS